MEKPLFDLGNEPLFEAWHEANYRPGKDYGDCLPKCLAYLFSGVSDDYPHFCRDYDEWQIGMCMWFGDRDYSVLWISNDEPTKKVDIAPKYCHFAPMIVVGQTGYGLHHSVVVKEKNIVFNSGNIELTEVKDLFFFIPNNPKLE